MNRYYDTETRTETHTESDTAIISTDRRVSCFFEEIPTGKELTFTDSGLPVITDIPTPTEAFLAEQAQHKINDAARRYLKSTDWYVVRNAESDTEIPADILTKRQAARASVV